MRISSKIHNFFIFIFCIAMLVGGQNCSNGNFVVNSEITSILTEDTTKNNPTHGDDSIDNNTPTDSEITPSAPVIPSDSVPSVDPQPASTSEPIPSGVNSQAVNQGTCGSQAKFLLKHRLLNNTEISAYSYVHNNMPYNGATWVVPIPKGTFAINFASTGAYGRTDVTLYTRSSLNSPLLELDSMSSENFYQPLAHLVRNNQRVHFSGPSALFFYDGNANDLSRKTTEDDFLYLDVRGSNGALLVEVLWVANSDQSNGVTKCL